MVYKVFRRPSIDIDALPKTWEDRPPWKVEVGAIVPDYGVVEDIQPLGDAGGSTSFSFSNGKFLYVDGSDTIYCFQ